MYLNQTFLATVATDIHNNYFHADFTLKSILHSEPISADVPLHFLYFFLVMKEFWKGDLDI